MQFLLMTCRGLTDVGVLIANYINIAHFVGVLQNLAQGAKHHRFIPGH
jgi:hypothetical protein